MKYEWVIALFEIAFGGLLAVHCPRAALSELRAGVAKGRVNHFRRDRDPAAFWLTIAATALAGLMGLLFLIFGVGTLGTDLGLLKL